MGTPAFAASTLLALINGGFDVAGVITAPDKPAGRGKKILESEVKKVAVDHHLTVLQPTNLKDPEFVKSFRALNANIGVVVAFRMLPEIIWAMPEYGTFNLHASLLPDYRGAAPINHAMMNGENETGLTTFFLKHDIDTGDIIFQEKTSIGESETVGELHDRLMLMGAGLVIKTLHAIQSGNYSLSRQADLAVEGRSPKVAPKIYKEDCRLDWDKPAFEVYNKIRGLSPYPAAFTIFTNESGESYNVKIYRAKLAGTSPDLKPGALHTDGKKYLSIGCQDGNIEVIELQMPGKKRMNIVQFLNGFNIDEQWRTSKG
jgi:methionyl-tRNA formyltransferase